MQVAIQKVVDEDFEQETNRRQALITPKGSFIRIQRLCLPTLCFALGTCEVQNLLILIIADLQKPRSPINDDYSCGFSTTHVPKQD